MVLFGWGLIALRLMGINRPAHPDTITVWLGFGIVLGILEFLQLFLPLDWKVSIGVLLIGMLGRIKSQLWLHSIKDVIQKFISRPLIGFVVFIIMLIWCLRAMGVVNNYDSGLYHFQTIRWLNEYQLVPGLGNLHWRLAFNQSYFNFLAVLNFYPYWNKGYAVGGLFLLFLSVCTVCEISLRQSKMWKYVFGIGLFIYFGYVASGVANPAPDGIIGLIQLTIFLLLFQILSLDKNNIKKASDQLSREIATVLALCFSTVTIKLTGALFAVTCVLIMAWVCRHVFLQKPLRWLTLTAVLTIFGLIHLGRGLLLSGFPLFPSTIFGITEFPWSMPKEFVKFEADLIMSWARMPGLLDPTWALSSWQWVPVWFKAMPMSTAYLLVFIIVIAPLTSIYLILGKIQGLSIKYLFLYLPIFATLTFWFLTAPDIRFLGSILVLGVLLTIWIWAQIFHFYQPALINSVLSHKNLRMAVVIAGALLSMKLTGLNSLGFLGWAEVPSRQVEIKKTISGFAVQIPVVGEQCWGEVLPCASIFNENLAKQNYSFYGLIGRSLLNNYYFTIKDRSPK